MESEQAAADELTWRWHDNVIHGLSFDLGEPDNGDWRSDLALDIDFIVEWLCRAPGESQFRVAPAHLIFHDVTDFAIAVDQGDSGGRNAIFEWSIDRVTRDKLERTFDYWRWTIHLHGPPGGSLAFAASGFTEELAGEPLLITQQRLPRSSRRAGRPE